MEFDGKIAVLRGMPAAILVRGSRLAVQPERFTTRRSRDTRGLPIGVSWRDDWSKHGRPLQIPGSLFTFMLFMLFMVQYGPTRFTTKGMKAMKGGTGC